MATPGVAVREIRVLQATGRTVISTSVSCSQKDMHSAKKIFESDNHEESVHMQTEKTMT